MDSLDTANYITWSCHHFFFHPKP